MSMARWWLHESCMRDATCPAMPKLIFTHIHAARAGARRRVPARARAARRA